MQSKNFTFKEENLRCQQHQEVIRYICQCNHKFCSSCVVDNRELDSHFKTHSDFKLYQIKDLKNLYVGQVEEIENILREINEVKEKSENENFKEKKQFINSNFAFREFLSNLVNLINFKVERFFEKLFAREDKIVDEMRKVTNINDIVIDAAGVISSIDKLIKLKEKGKFSLLRTFEKINSVQNLFLNNIEIFLQEFQYLLDKYFVFEKERYKQEEGLHLQLTHLKNNVENDNIITENEIEEKKITHLETEEKQAISKANCEELNSYSIHRDNNLHKSILDSESISSPKIEKETKSKVNKTLVVNLNLNLSRNTSNNKDFKIYNLEDIPDSNNSKNSILKSITNFAEEANIFTNSNFKNIKSNSLWKEGIIPEISDSIENISYYMKSNKVKQKNLSDSSISHQNKSLISEFNFNINKENRNRINKIIFYKKQRRLEFLNRSANNKANKKHKVGNGGQSTPINYNDQYLVNGFASKNYKFPNQVNPNFNQENVYHNYNGFNINSQSDKEKNQANTKVNNVKKLCADCYTPFNVKNTNNWKKRCLPCQKTFYEKITHIKSFYSVNSYKAGKMNQTCSKCKNNFIVPVALAKQRKTCYYCFKSNINTQS